MRANQGETDIMEIKVKLKRRSETESEIRTEVATYSTTVGLYQIEFD